MYCIYGTILGNRFPTYLQFVVQCKESDSSVHFYSNWCYFLKTLHIILQVITGPVKYPNISLQMFAYTELLIAAHTYIHIRTYVGVYGCCGSSLCVFIHIWQKYLCVWTEMSKFDSHMYKTNTRVKSIHNNELRKLAMNRNACMCVYTHT